MSNLTKLTDFSYQIELYVTIPFFIQVFITIHTLLFITRTIKKIEIRVYN